MNGKIAGTFCRAVGYVSAWIGLALEQPQIPRSGKLAVLNKDKNKDLFVEAQAAMAEYHRIVGIFDGQMLAAHNSGHKTAKYIEHLKAAIAVADDMSEALNRYQTAVSNILEWYNFEISRRPAY